MNFRKRCIFTFIIGIMYLNVNCYNIILTFNCEVYYVFRN
nr:MAG TPA: hypothetical protein [Caudoviricetes sp.]